jgi:hypothetical protein
MTDLYESPASPILVACLLLLATTLTARGVRSMAAALRHGHALDLIRGIRIGILGFVAAVFALGIVLAQTGFVVLGALVLAEELYETGLLALIIRRGERPPCPSSLRRAPGRGRAPRPAG